MKDLVRKNSNNEMDRIRSGIDQVFADAFFRNWPASGQRAFPPVDLFNTEGSLMAVVNLPGVDINEVEVTTNNDTLTISGDLKVEPVEGELLWQEQNSGKFYRSFKLPVPIKADAVDASYKAGVLRVEKKQNNTSKRLSVFIEPGVNIKNTWSLYLF